MWNPEYEIYDLRMFIYTESADSQAMFGRLVVANKTQAETTLD